MARPRRLRSRPILLTPTTDQIDRTCGRKWLPNSFSASQVFWGDRWERDLSGDLRLNKAKKRGCCQKKQIEELADRCAVRVVGARLRQRAREESGRGTDAAASSPLQGGAAGNVACVASWRAWSVVRGDRRKLPRQARQRGGFYSIR